MATRYDIEKVDYDYSEMVERHNGDYVSYSDYEDLLEAYMSLCCKIRDLYAETP